jgi:hypothetical protein
MIFVQNDIIIYRAEAVEEKEEEMKRREREIQNQLHDYSNNEEEWRGRVREEETGRIREGLVKEVEERHKEEWARRYGFTRDFVTETYVWTN